MSDARLRELERTWRTTGAVADEAAWLAERLRAGALAEVRLLLAAELGHAAAAQAVAPLPREPLLKWWPRADDFARSGAWWSRHIMQLAAALGDDAARALVVTELVPWALGRGDPLKERVEARRKS